MFQKKARIDYIDVARGIGIICVVVGHMIPMKYGVGQYIYSFHIPLFFILSGFLLYFNESWKHGSLKDIIIYRIQKFLFPYFTFSFLSIVFIFFRFGFKNAVIQTKATICFDGILTLWFLPALLIAEIIFIMVMRHIKLKRVRIFIFFLLLLTIIFYGLVVKLHNTDISTSGLQGIKNILTRGAIGALFVYIGYGYAYVVSKITISLRLCVISLTVVFTVNLCLYRNNYVDLHYSIIGHPILFFINSICGSYVVIELSRILFRNLKLLSFWGKNSIIIFVTHLNFSLVEFSQNVIKIIVGDYNVILAVILLLVIESVIIWGINKYGKVLISYNDLKKQLRCWLCS